MNHQGFMSVFADYPIEEQDQIEHAYILSKDAHRSQTRLGGGRYFDHPKRVALVLVDELGVKTWEDVCAALLHDTVEDTKYITVPKIRRWFNSTVADLVDLLTKVPGKVQREYYTRMAGISRAIIIKGCDRLDNLRDLETQETGFIEKQLHSTRTHVLPMIQKCCELQVTDRNNMERMSKLSALIRAELAELDAVLAARKKMVTCEFQGCDALKNPSTVMCDSCMAGGDE